MVQVWKIAPGQGAEDWELFRKHGCIGLGWQLQDYSQYRSKKEVLAALEQKYGKGKDGFGAGAAKIIWQFVEEVRMDDIVVANKGYNKVVGIGVITSEYLPPTSMRNPIRNNTSTHRRHIRSVTWLITDPVDLTGSHFFVQPTLWPLEKAKVDQILKAYNGTYPQLKVRIEQLIEVYQVGTTDRWPDDVSSAIEDLKTIDRREDIDPTTKEILVHARLGQGKFRTDVLRQWGNSCAVTHSVTTEAIRASHIKPRCESNDEERLDPNNGLPLLANFDALFDAGLISFDSSGTLIVSSKMVPSEQAIFGITGRETLTKTPTAETVVFLANHRRKHGFETKDAT